MRSKLKVVDLFCGCGGFSQGFQAAGFEIVAGIDIDAQALLTYEKNFPKAKAIKADLSKLSAQDFELIRNCDVLLGGPPCQGFSVAGNLNKSDQRNDLVYSYLKIIKKILPKFVVIENVPNILNFANGEFSKAIVSGLNKLGYSLEIMKINCSEYGVPQNRKRVFFIAVLQGDFNTNFLLSNKIDEKTTVFDAISDLPLLDNELGESKVNYLQAPITKYQKSMRLNSKFIFNHESVNHTEKTKSIIALVPDGGNYKDLPSNLHSTRKVNIAWTRMDSKKPCFTIDAGHNHHFHYQANRVPTVRECARIQSFPDNFIFLGNRTSQYRQVGNAVPPLMAKIIGESLIASM